MKKHILLLLLFGLTTQLIVAQDMEFTVGPVVVLDIHPADFEAVGYSAIVNTGDAERQLTWTSTEVAIEGDWTFAICDKNLCYGSDITSETFVLEADSAGRMDVHAYPGGNIGSAVVEVTVTDDANPNLSTSNLYYFNVDPASSTTEAGRQTIKVYPNPSNGLFSIKGSKFIDHVDILSLTGRQVSSFRYNDGQWYDISNLPTGTYLVRLIDRDGQHVITKLMNKL